MPRRRQKRKIVKQSELLQILKYLIPKQGIVKSIAGDINPLAFQTGRGGYTNPYLLQSAEQKVVNDTNKAYITIKTDTPGFKVDNKAVDERIEPSENVRIERSRKEKFVKEEFKKRGIPFVPGDVTKNYGGGSATQTYQGIIDGTFDWEAVAEAAKNIIERKPREKKERKQPEKKESKQPEKKNN